MSEHKTYDPAIDQSLDELTGEFIYNAQSEYVPVSCAMESLSVLISALDWNCVKGEITRQEVEDRFKQATDMMMVKFKMHYKKLPR
jgi:hypothetical protein